MKQQGQAGQADAAIMHQCADGEHVAEWLVEVVRQLQPLSDTAADPLLDGERRDQVLARLPRPRHPIEALVLEALLLRLGLRMWGESERAILLGAWGRAIIELLPHAFAPMPSDCGCLVAAARGLCTRDLSRRWSVRAAARHVGVPPHQLSSAIHSVTGLSFSAFATGIRIRVAAQRLLTTSDKVATVAHDVGYRSRKNFYRMFERVIGEPPGAYRRRRSSCTEHDRASKGT